MFFAVGCMSGCAFDTWSVYKSNVEIGVLNFHVLEPNIHKNCQRNSQMPAGKVNTWVCYSSTKKPL